MSNNHMSFFSRFVLSCCAVFGLSMVAMSPAGAQHGITSTKTLFAVQGLSGVMVSASGDLQGSPSECPFSDYNMEKITTAFEAAKGGDPDSCPYAQEPSGRKIYFRSCKTIYEELGKKAADVIHPTANTNISCCWLPPGSRREKCKGNIRAGEALANLDLAYISKLTGVIPDGPNVLSAEEARKIQDARKEKDEIEKQCFNDSFNRIGEYWAKKRGVSCIRFVSRAVKTLITDGTRGLRSAMLGQVATGTSSTMTYGAMTAIASMPSAWGLGVTATAAVNFAADVVTLASQASDILGTLSDACGNVLPELRQLQQWRETVLGTNLCQAAENLLERQLTQCIRVNLTASSALNLPQFSLMLQCPVNINLDMRISPRGFDCYGRASVGSPIAISGGRRSLLSGGGGLENLFNGNCFTSPSSRPGSGGVAPAESSGDTRTPGVDCGPLDPNTAKQSLLRGVNVLAQGRTSNGWAIGGKESVNGLQVTRCDLYDGGRHIRSAYVYGDGSSCRTQEGGFMSGGYETNTACYGGYAPANGPSVPDACLYDPGCLDARGNLDTSRIGTSNCLSANPVFDPNRIYNTFVSGGINNPSQNQGNYCSDFAEADPNALADSICCDPQRQDCRQRDANVPLCMCDEGDAMNRVKMDATGAMDPLGRCEQGGKVTCCSPRLNGGHDVCTTQMKMPICEAEKVDQCVKTDEKVVYTGPDGRTNNSFSAAQVAQSKPSPYLYLFVRPDVTMPDGQQCCTTEWCNICPQHYANAYGLSLKRDNTYLLPSSDADNHRIIGRGWPFMVSANDEPVSDTDPLNLDTLVNTEYKIGVNEVRQIFVNLTWPEPGKVLGIGRSWEDREVALSASAIPLHINDSLKLPASLETCNNLSYLKVKPLSSNSFSGQTGGNSAMGFAFNYNVYRSKKGEKWTVYASVPEPQEYPVDYLNRLRRGVNDADGMPLMPISLCSEVSICTPEAANGLTPQPGVGGGISPIRTTSSLGTITLQPTVTPGVTTPPANTVSTPTGTTAPQQRIAPTAPAAVAPTTVTPSVTPSASGQTGSGSSGSATGKYGLY